VEFNGRCAALSPEPTGQNVGGQAGARDIALSHFCYRRRKTLAPQGSRKLPKLDVAGWTPVARSLNSRFFAALRVASRGDLRSLDVGAGSGAGSFAGEALDRIDWCR